MSAEGPQRRVAVVLSTVHFAQHVFRILPPVLPLLAIAFPYPLWKLGALVSVYFLGSGFGQTPMGILVDRYDRRLVLPPSVAMMGVGYLVFALAPGLIGADAAAITVAGEPFTVQFLLMGVGVLIAGIGASAIHPAGLSLVAANARSGAEGRAFGAWGSASKLGDAAAPTAVALLILVVAWNDVFLIFGVLGVVYAVGLFWVMSREWIDTRPANRRDDTGPSGEADTSNADGEPVAEREGETDRRRYVYPMLVLLAFYVARSFSEKGVKTFLPTFIVGVYGYAFTVGGVDVPPESFANFYFTAVFLIAAGTSLVTGWLVDRYDHRTVLIAFFLVATATTVVLAAGTLSPVALLAVLLVLGASNWGWTPARDTLVNDVMPAEREGRTFGYLYTISHIASAVAPVAIGYIAEASSLRLSFLWVAATMLVAIGAIASLYSRRVYRPPDERYERSGTAE